MGRDLRQIRGWILLVLIAGGLALVGAELALRRFRPQPLLWNGSLVWEAVAGLGKQHRAGIDVRLDTGDGSVRVRTDAARHRVGSAASAEPELRVLAMGDSCVEALQVEHEHSLTERLARGLSQQLEREVAVVNAGVGGWNPNHYRIATRAELAEHRYDQVLLFLFLENDVVRTVVEDFPPGRRWLAPPLVSPGTASFAESYSALRARVGFFLQSHSHFWVFAREQAARRRVRRGASEDHVLTALLRSQAESPRWGVTAEIVAGIRDDAEAHGVPLITVLLPSRHFVEAATRTQYLDALALSPEDIDVGQPSLRLGVELGARGVRWLDTTPALRRASAGGREPHYGRVDERFNHAGHRVVAEVLEPVVARTLAP